MKDIKIVLHTENVDIQYIQKINAQFYYKAAQTLLEESSLSISDKQRLLFEVAENFKS